MSIVLLLALLAVPPSPKLLRLPAETIVLTYHDVIAKRDKDALWFDCTSQELIDQIDWMISKGCHFISVDQLYRHLSTGEALPAMPVLITFADNYLGFYERGLPLLRERKIPTVMFVHTDFVGNSTGRPKMSWKQLLELDKEGLVTIASQTRTHPQDLTKLNGEQLRWELVGSRRVLEEKLGHEILYLAYPNGKFDDRVATYSEAAKYKMAFTEEQEPAEIANSIFVIPRYVHTKFRTAIGQQLRLLR
ncbi:MAG TPA: polysaccharide deacetylase family protein [Fimbriimonas sp.]|nr:polysaccharide deacetylase family protein [Fimbriimonas sp.]